MKTKIYLAIIIILIILAVIPWLPVVWLKNLNMNYWSVKHGDDYQDAYFSINIMFGELAKVHFNALRLLHALEAETNVSRAAGIIKINDQEVGKIEVNKSWVEIAAAHNLFPKGDYFKGKLTHPIKNELTIPKCSQNQEGGGGKYTCE
jgi:hypothetical protein